MKIKLIALAVAALVSGGANATLVSATANANEMFVNAWNANGSYTKDLGISFGSFAATVANFGGLNLSLNDTAFAAFIAGGSAFSWDITGANGVGNFTTLTTLNGPAPAAAPSKGIMVPSVGGINGFGLSVDGAMPAGTVAGQTVVDGNALYTAGTTAATYAGTAGGVSDTAFAAFAISGTEANNSAATGLNFIKEVSGSTGLNTVKATQSVYRNTVAYMSNSGGAYNLNVAAVPEPESLAMLLAGLGMIGSVVARRSRKA